MLMIRRRKAFGADDDDNADDDNASEDDTADDDDNADNYADDDNAYDDDTADDDDNEKPFDWEELAGGQVSCKTCIVSLLHIGCCSQWRWWGQVGHIGGHGIDQDHDYDVIKPV